MSDWRLVRSVQSVCVTWYLMISADVTLNNTSVHIVFSSQINEAYTDYENYYEEETEQKY